MSDAALATSLGKARGLAFIALRTPGASRVAETLRTEVVGSKRKEVLRGTRAAISEASIADGLKAIAAHGVVVRQFFDATAIVEALIDGSDLTALRSDPHVEFIEPVVNDFRTIEPHAPPASEPSNPLGDAHGG